VEANCLIIERLCDLAPLVELGGALAFLDDSRFPFARAERSSGVMFFAALPQRYN
jgi:hypothetical protein